ncbi:spinster family MFS transporter [Rhizorhabdus sp. FW153]|uniref:spinster family MFS transporter n=1 Tax=Rhizorhabdus sp. FW153 TaxID=3400216 RepID=UPI003CEE1CB8
MEQDERRGWYVVLLCMVAYIFSFIDRQILALLIAPIQADLGISDTQFGLLHGLAFSLFYATMGIPVATLSDRTSRPLIIATGVAFWSAATMACGLARSFPSLFLARICVGAGEAALSPATYSLISTLFPKEKLGRAVAVYSLGSFLGSGIAFLAGGAVIAMVSGADSISLAGIDFRSWQLAFLIVGAPGLLLACVIHLTIKEPAPRGARGGGKDRPALKAVLAFLVRERAIFVPHMLGYTFAAMALFALLGWSPAYLMRSYGMTPAAAGLWLGVVIVFAGGGGVLASGWLMDRLTRGGVADAPFRTGIVGALGTLLPTGALPFAPSFAFGMALLSIALFFASFPMPPSTAVMQIIAPPTMRSRVSAIFLCSNSLIGLTLGSLAVGLLNDRLFSGAAAVGHSLGIVAACASIIAAALLALGCRPYAAAQRADQTATICVT